MHLCVRGWLRGRIYLYLIEEGGGGKSIEMGGLQFVFPAILLPLKPHKKAVR